MDLPDDKYSQDGSTSGELKQTEHQNQSKPGTESVPDLKNPDAHQLQVNQQLQMQQKHFKQSQNEAKANKKHCKSRFYVRKPSKRLCVNLRDYHFHGMQWLGYLNKIDSNGILRTK